MYRIILPLRKEIIHDTGENFTSHCWYRKDNRKK